LTRALARDRNFNVFWVGQGLSSLGDAISIVAIPLLVLQATGSLASMGIVTAVYGLGSLLMGIVAGPIVDRFDRRRLMLRCDFGRCLVYALVPIGWSLIGPQLWLVYLVSFLGSALAMLFGVAYITAVANLVDRDQITEANGRLQATYALAFVLGPMLAGFIAGRFGAATAIGLDAVTFLASAASLRFVRLRRAAAERPAGEAGGRRQEFLAGVRFLIDEPIFRWLTILIGGLSFLSTGINDLLIYYLRVDLGEPDRTVGVVFGIASLGAVAAGIATSRLRGRFGFGPLFIAAFAAAGLTLLAMGLGPAPIALGLIATVYTFSDSVRGVLSMSVRQELTPDHLLGRVTAAFWTVFAVPGPIGAVLLTRLGERIGATATFGVAGVIVLALAVLALGSPVRARTPTIQSVEGIDEGQGEGVGV
jgi:MFS family permease